MTDATRRREMAQPLNANPQAIGTIENQESLLRDLASDPSNSPDVRQLAAIVSSLASRIKISDASVTALLEDAQAQGRKIVPKFKAT